MPDTVEHCSETPLADSTEIVVLGKIVGPYGVYGAVRIHPFADDPQDWAKLPQWWLGRENEAPSLWRPSKLIKCKMHNDSLIAELACVPDRNASETMHGVLVGVPRDALPPTAKNEYYWADLTGLEVVNTHGESLGQVLGLIGTPANDVLRVGSEGSGENAERLLPFVKTVVLDVDIANKRICVDWETDW